MIRHKHSTTIQLGDTYEFCRQLTGKPSEVHFGEVIEINPINKTFTFRSIKRGKGMKILPDLDGELFHYIDTIRNAGIIHEDTWKVDS